MLKKRRQIFAFWRKRVDKYTRNQKICELYFIEKMIFSEIATEVNISISQVSRIVGKREEYNKEKNRRKEETKERHKMSKRRFKAKNRSTQVNEKAILDYIHNQDCRELSGRQTINNRAFRKCNSSIYDYYEQTNEYRLKEEFKDKTSYAVPKKVKMS